MTAHSATQADGPFLHRILILLIVATLSSGAAAAISIAKSPEPGKATVVTQQS